MDERIKAIRNDALVGRGTLSSIDECYDDSELVKQLDDYNIHTPAAAVKWAREWVGAWVEEGLNQRWGEDDDPQLLDYNEWQEKLDRLNQTS
tara:strand:+ start:80 stop:355 length:276 start_codon:yes stop_codon:yes gene_type:complete